MAVKSSASADIQIRRSIQAERQLYGHCPFTNGHFRQLREAHSLALAAKDSPVAVSAVYPG